MTTQGRQPLLRRILVPTDFSPTADAALDTARDYAAAHDAELVILHVAWTTDHVLGTGAFVWTEQMAQDLEQAARRQLHERAERLRVAGVSCRMLTVAGLPDETIAKTAEDERADLVVMGTHGRTGFARAMLGSIAQRVVARAPCPVLLVRGPIPA